MSVVQWQEEPARSVLSFRQVRQKDQKWEDRVSSKVDSVRFPVQVVVKSEEVRDLVRVQALVPVLDSVKVRSVPEAWVREEQKGLA
jgi:hypothetical protein